MRRTLFNLTIALLAFGIGLFIVFKTFWMSKETTVEERVINQTLIEKETPIGFGSGTGFRNGDKQQDEEKYVPKLHKPTCTDKTLLPIWNELLKDKEFQEQSKEFYQEADCKNLLEIQKVDLNGDGQKEIVLWGEPRNLCGATGNCYMWIYEKKNGKYRQLLQSNAYKNGEEKWFDVDNKKSKGYRNFLLKGHATGYETTEHYYEFDGNQYNEVKCLFLSYYPDENNPSIMTCKEAWER